MIRIVITGSRSFKDYHRFSLEMDAFVSGMENKIELISGHAAGTDRLAERYAKERGIPITVIEAEWSLYGKAAGPLRNRRMLEYAGEEDPLVLAFWNGTSRGTLDTIRKAREMGYPVTVYAV